MTILVTVEALVLALLAVLVVGLLRSHAEILRRLHQLGAGLDDDDLDERRGQGRTRQAGHVRVMPQMPSPPPREGFTGGHDLSGSGLADDAVTVRVTRVEHDTMLAFLTSGCLTCRRFWEAFADPAALGLPLGVRLVVVTKDPAEESVSAIAGMAPRDVPLVMSSRGWEDYDVPGSPYFVLVDGPSGSVRGEGTGPDWEQVARLLTQATGDASVAAGLARDRVRKPDADAAREARIDDELLAAGVAPGDRSLYQVAEELRADDDHDPTPRPRPS